MKYKIANALSSLKAGSAFMVHGDDYASIQWMDETTPMPSEAEVNAEIERQSAPNEAQQIEACKLEAKTRLEATDWAMLPDVNISNRAAFETYRDAVRVLYITPVAVPEWPERPEAIWL